MLLADAPLSFHEFTVQEKLPLAEVFQEIFVYLQGRDDVALFGAHAVNSYCQTERMTQDVDLLAINADAFAEALRSHLATKFHMAARTRTVAHGSGIRIYQLREPKNRHLVDVRQTNQLPPRQLADGVWVVAPDVLIAMKVISWTGRFDQPKGATDLADLRRLLLAKPELKAIQSAVATQLFELSAPAAAIQRWTELVNTAITADNDDDY